MSTTISHSDTYHHKHLRFTGTAPDREMQKARVRALKTDNSLGATATNNIRLNKSAQVNFGGFFNGFFDKLGKNPKVVKFHQNEKFLKLTEFPKDNAGFFESGFALIITTLVRPLTILATPGSKKEDKQCASVQSMLSGCIDFVMTGALLKPVDIAISKVQKEMLEDPKKYLKHVPKESQKAALDRMQFMFNYGSKSALIPLRSFLTIALIPPTLKLLFPKKNNIKNQQDYYKTNYNLYLKNNKAVNNKVFANFLGVNK